MASPQSKPSAVSKAGWPGHSAAAAFRLLLLLIRVLLERVTYQALVTRMPSKLASRMVNPDTDTFASPGVSRPSMLIPTERPLASMVVLLLPAPTNESGM